jgi:hypothetical protein
MVRAKGNSNVATVAPGQRQELLRYCLPDDIPEKVIGVNLTSQLINESVPSVPYYRDVKAELLWQGERGGGTALVDVGRGTAVNVIGSTLQVTIINQSPTPEPADPPDINDYRIEVSAANYPVSHWRPYVSERVAIGADEPVTGLIRIPQYARDLLLFANPIPAGPGFPVVQFYSTNFAVPAVPTAALLANSPTNQVNGQNEIPVIAGAEWALITNPDLVARTFTLVWHLHI